MPIAVNRAGSLLPASNTPKFLRSLLPAAALLLAGLSPAFAAPAQPASASVQLEGEVQVQIEDYAKSSRTRYFLKTEKGQIELKPTHAQEAKLQTGAKVRVRGRQSGELLALDGGDTSVSTVSPAPLPNTTGERKMAVVLVNFQDNMVQPYTVTTGNNVISQVNSFIRENSLNQTTVSGSSYGWYTLPMATTCDSAKIASAAQQAAANAGVNLSNFHHRVYVFPRNSACPWNGLATVGGNNLWINGSLEMRVVSHELGHNFGLFHSHALECGSSVGGSSCTSMEYGDLVDTMGNSRPGHFNALQKERLGWLNNGSMPPITAVNASGSYTLSPYASSATGAKALKILKSVDGTTGLKTYYYVEFRQAIGYDSFISTLNGSNIANGVIVRTGSDSNGNSSYVLDMTPGSSSMYDWYDQALVLGQSFTDPASGVTITPTVVSSTGATINVTLSQQTVTSTCTRANPTITPSTQSKSGSAGSSVSYTVTVTNKDSSACAASSFSLSATPVSGWGATFSSNSVSLAPGASTNVNLTLSAPSTATGTTSLGFKAAHGAASTYQASASASYSVTSTVSTYSITAVTDKASYSSNQTVAMSAQAKAGSAAVVGGTVVFTLIDPKGMSVVQSAVTDSSGVARSSYRLNRKAAKGSYQLRTTLSGQSVSASKSFTVQ